ncbi:Uncharacterised protein [Enterobacter cloacae]|nr:Uncharacterised protein [Enterobacter cloacae]
MLSNEAIVQCAFRAIDHGVAVIAFIGRVARVNHFRLRIIAVSEVDANQYQGDKRKQNDNPTSGFTHIDCPFASSSLPCDSRSRSQTSRTAPRPP